jgi:hypothetical protein
VIPCVRGRLAFARLVACALEEERFDCVALDLPRFTGHKDWLDRPLGLFPYASSLIIRSADSRVTLLPFVPTDAACIAALLTRKSSGEIACLDDSKLVNYPDGSLFHPACALRDDYFVFTDGPEKYFAPAWEQMNDAWIDASPMRQQFTGTRASLVAQRLRRLLQQHKKTLFVCDYTLWWSVKRQLDGNEAPPEKPLIPLTGPCSAALAMEDPYLLWARGLFDDYPQVNLRFHLKTLVGKASSFDKADALQNILIQSTTAGALGEAGNPSVRLLVAFERYLTVRVSSSQRIVPLPASQLFDSAHSCVGSEFAERLSKKLLSYPTPDVSAEPAFLRITGDAISDDGESFDLPDANHCRLYYESAESGANPGLTPEEENERERWVDLVHPHITRQEFREMGQELGGVRWAVKDDYRLHQNVCSYIRDIVRRLDSAHMVRRSWGSLNDGIHWKATLSAMARGEEALYVKRRIRRRHPMGKMDEFTPIVFIFTDDLQYSVASAVHDSNITLRNIELQNAGANSKGSLSPDLFYSVFSTSRSTELMRGADIQKDKLTSLAFLMTRATMGLERYDAIRKRPRPFQCKVSPMEDCDLRGFRPSDLGLAWAVKYASKVVVAVVYSGWKPSSEILRFADHRGVSIMVVPLSVLSAPALRRLKEMYFISTRLKKHPANEKIVRRFVH